MMSPESSSPWRVRPWSRFPFPLATLGFPTLGLGSLLLIAACAPRAPEPAALDHFLCYSGPGGETIGETIELEDQFDRLAHRPGTVEVVRPFAFCNPVAKSAAEERGEVQDRDHHLVAYRIATESSHRWRATFFNQITPDGGDLAFRRAEWMLVPTHKTSPNDHRPPSGLDHFKCYAVAGGDPVERSFDLDDQFPGELRDVPLTRPLAVCAPAEKRREGREPEPAGDAAHLVCYGLERPAEQVVRYSNQFEPAGGLLLDRAFGLCVPTRKEGVRRGSEDGARG